MTLIDIQNTLVDHFIKNDSFILSRDLDLFVLKGKDNDDQDDINKVKKELVSTALKVLVEASFLKEITPDYYCLTAPIGNFQQSIDISPYTADIVSDIINSYRKVRGIEDEVSNKLAITENDIQNLGTICLELMEELDLMQEELLKLKGEE